MAPDTFYILLAFMLILFYFTTQDETPFFSPGKPENLKKNFLSSGEVTELGWVQ